MDQKTKKPAAPQSYGLQVRGWYRIVQGVLRLAVKTVTRIEVEGLEQIPDKGPYLLVTNHLHWLDPPIISATFPYRPFLFAAEKWESHWFLGPFFRSINAIFVQRGEVDRKALRQALEVLEHGGVLGMAPEGTRSRVGAMQKGRSGAAYMAYRTGARLVPVAVSGQEKLGRSLRRLRRAPVRVQFGPPFAPPPLPAGEKPSAAAVHDFADEIMYHLAALLPAEYRGVYADVAEKRPELLAQVGVFH